MLMQTDQVHSAAHSLVGLFPVAPVLSQHFNLLLTIDQRLPEFSLFLFRLVSNLLEDCFGCISYREIQG